jgi:hypothetical protein
MVWGRNNGQEQRAMPNYLSEEIRKCRLKAKDCAHQAAVQTDPKLKQDFLDMEESWLFLARSFAHHERKSEGQHE